jgi:hypothetical protein
VRGNIQGPIAVTTGQLAKARLLIDWEKVKADNKVRLRFLAHKRWHEGSIEICIPCNGTQEEKQRYFRSRKAKNKRDQRAHMSPQELQVFHALDNQRNRDRYKRKKGLS